MPIYNDSISEIAPKSLRLAFLINPISGGGIGAKVFRQLPEILNSFGFSKNSWLAELTNKDSLSEQTDRLLQNAKRLIAVGGDGTIGFVLDRLTQAPNLNTEIGLIPLGTGNDLARSLGIFRVYDQHGLLATVKRLIKASASAIDLWRVNQEYTLAAYLSTGLDAAVLHNFDLARKAGRIPKGRIFNQLYYVKSFFERLHYRIDKKAWIQWKEDNGIKKELLGEAVCAIVGNVNSYAAGAKPFPSCSFQDKKLEISIFRNIWHYAMVASLSRFLPGWKYFGKKLTKSYQATEITLFPGRHPFVQLDGEDLSQAQDLLAQPIEIRWAGQVQILDLANALQRLF